MEIDINGVLASNGEVFSVEFDGAFADVVYQGQRYEFTDGVRVEVSYFLDNEGIVVTGSFEAKTMVGCSKCLKEFEYTVSYKFTEYYRKSQQEADYLYLGYSIDLTQMLQDNLILNLPDRHVCNVACKGLCSMCGMDMNEQQCDCEPEQDETNPFHGLSELIDDEEV